MAGRIALMTSSTCSSTSSPIGNCPSLASAEANADTGNGIPDAYDHGVNSLTLAHQGGWDEILMVAGPVLIFAWLLSIARKRAQTWLTPKPRSDRLRPIRECLTPS